MNNFTFANPTKLIFGKGMIEQLAVEIPIESKILITFGGGSVKHNGVYAQVKSALANHNALEFWGIEPNPDFDTLMKAVALARSEKVDFLLAVGGGSVLDGTKFISQAIPYNGDAWEIVKNPALTRPTIPVASVMTLPATGSEMNHRAVISYRAKQEKLAFMSKHLFPKFSILDPEATYTLPKQQICNGVVDTFIHVMEQYLTYPAQTMVMDRWAEGILQTLIELGPKVIAQQNDYDTMSNYMLCSTLALNEFISMGTPQDWATHRIGHEVTALYGIDHAPSLALLYPALLKVLFREKKAKLLQYGQRVWGINTGTEEERATAAIEQTEAFFRRMGMKIRFSEYKIGSEAVDAITERVRSRGLIYGENKTVTPEVVKLIIETAL